MFKDGCTTKLSMAHKHSTRLGRHLSLLDHSRHPLLCGTFYSMLSSRVATYTESPFDFMIREKIRGLS